METMRIRRRRPRTLRSFVLRALVPRIAAFLGIAAMLGMGQAMAVSPSAESAEAPADRAAAPAPSWTAADAAAFPGCRAAAAWPKGVPAAYVVVHSFREDRHLEVAFDEAWRDNHDHSEADDVWVIGICGKA